MMRKISKSRPTTGPPSLLPAASGKQMADGQTGLLNAGGFLPMSKFIFLQVRVNNDAEVIEDRRSGKPDGPRLA